MNLRLPVEDNNTSIVLTCSILSAGSCIAGCTPSRLTAATEGQGASAIGVDQLAEHSEHVTVYADSGPLVSTVFRQCTAVPALPVPQEDRSGSAPAGERMVVTEVTVMLAAGVEHGVLAIKLLDLQMRSFVAGQSANDIMAENVTITLSTREMVLRVEELELCRADCVYSMPQFALQPPWDALVVRLANGRWSSELGAQASAADTHTAAVEVGSASQSAATDTVVGTAGSMLTVYSLNLPPGPARCIPGLPQSSSAAMSPTPSSCGMCRRQTGCSCCSRVTCSSRETRSPHPA